MDQARLWMENQIEIVVRSQMESCQEQLEVFLKMGYSINDLTLVRNPEGTFEVTPLLVFQP